MAPIKFENDIKQKLEQRKIQPNSKAWETLQNRLDINEKNKNKKGYWWFGLAASFVGILIVSSFFFNSNKGEVVEPIMVETESLESPNQIKDVVNENLQEAEVVIEEQPKNKLVKPATKKKNVTKTPELKRQLQQKQKALIKGEAKAVVAQAEVSTAKELKENILIPNKELSFEDLKFNEVVAQVEALKKEKNTVSDAEINALLDQAQKEITLHKLYNEATKKVDANALLQDVEADLEQSFRDRAFKAIKSGYYYVKTSVAERNN